MILYECVWEGATAWQVQGTDRRREGLRLGSPAPRAVPAQCQATKTPQSLQPASAATWLEALGVLLAMCPSSSSFPGWEN